MYEYGSSPEREENISISRFLPNAMLLGATQNGQASPIVAMVGFWLIIGLLWFLMRKARQQRVERRARLILEGKIPGTKPPKQPTDRYEWMAWAILTPILCGVVIAAWKLIGAAAAFPATMVVAPGAAAMRRDVAKRLRRGALVQTAPPKS
ncbi:MAG: hypothetical protein ACJ77Z_01840 [Thermoleophilaceae bacterium]